MLIIRNGQVYDGTGAESVLKDIEIKDDMIADIMDPGSCPEEDAQVIDAKGFSIAPGFIDAHSHDDTGVLRFPQNRTSLLQGVTTEVVGNCGFSAFSVPGECAGFQWKDPAGYVQALEQAQVSTNTVTLCGHNSIRREVMGNHPGTASPDELREMKKLMERAFEAGAAGWSSGLTYFPGKFADTAELCALSELTKGTQKIYATHMRSEGDTLIEAVKETIEIAKAGSERLEVSHLKTIFPRNFYKISALLETLENARHSGLDLHADRYPYVYSSTRIGQILPAPYDKDTEISMKLRSSNSLQNEIAEALKKSPRDLATTILLSTGKTLAETAHEQNISLETFAMRVLMDNAEQAAAYLCMSEENLERILALDWVCAGSDGGSMQLDNPQNAGHPRAVGTFPKFFRMVAKMQGTAETVRRMTSLPASIFRIPKRGIIRKGYFADLVIFDPDRYDSCAGFHKELLMPAGIRQVIVNGRTAWNADEPDKIGRYGHYIPIN